MSYNFRHHVASDIGLHNQFIPPELLKSQQNLAKINSWTEFQKMKLNLDKTKLMIFNYTRKYQFSTRIETNSINLETIDSTKLLGVIVRNDLSWIDNTAFILKSAYKKMPLLTKLYTYNIPCSDLIHIYITYIRSKLEYGTLV